MLIKLIAPLVGKGKYESLVYKVEVYYDHNAMKHNNQKAYSGSTQDVFKKDFITINVVSPMRRIQRELD